MTSESAYTYMRAIYAVADKWLRVFESPKEVQEEVKRARVLVGG